MSSKIATVVLILLLLIIQGQLWLGRTNMFTDRELKREVAGQIQNNQLLTQENERLTAEIANLQQGTAAAEGLARRNLEMVKPNEIFVELAR